MKQLGILISMAFLSGTTFSQWSYTEQATGFQNSALHSVDIIGQKVYVGGVCGTTASQINHLNMLKSEDGGQTWSELHSSGIGSEYLYTRNLHFFNELTGLATCSTVPGYYAESTDEQFIIKTTDGGSSWSTVYEKNASHSFETMSAMEFFNETNGIVVGHFDDNGWFDIQPWAAITSNGGDSWTDITLPTAMDGKEINGLDIEGNTAYLLLQDGYDFVSANNSCSFYVYKSTDMGQTWTQLASMPFPQEYHTQNVVDGASVNDIDFGSANVGYICFSESKHKSYVYKTTDAGVTWTDIQAPMNETSGHANLDFNDIHFINADEGFVAAGNFCDDNACYRGHGLMYTSDGGNNWTIIDHEPYDSYSFVEVNYEPLSDIGYVVGAGITFSNGRIFKFEHPSAEQVELEEIAFNLYPNPSNGVVQIDGLKKDASVHVLSIDGKSIQELSTVNGKLEINLKPGVYLIKIGATTKKLTIAN